MSKIYLKSYLRGMKKGKPKTMAELTKNFDEFMESKEPDPKAGEKFEKLLGKMIKKKHKPKGNGK